MGISSTRRFIGVMPAVMSYTRFGLKSFVLTVPEGKKKGLIRMKFDIDKKIKSLEFDINYHERKLQEAREELEFSLAMKAANRETAHLVDTDEDFQQAQAS